MASFDAGATLADRMRAHAGDREHLYAVLMRELAADWEASGPTREICRGWEHAPEGAVVQLRLLAGVFRIVLTGRAPQLVPFYPCLGGHEPAAEAWPPFREVLAANVVELHAALDVAPQTNETGRSIALLIGLFHAVRSSGIPRVRLFEVGASAGLNLLLDRFRFTGDDWEVGPADAPLTLSGVIGPVEPVAFEIIDRRGCDLAPIDPRSEAGRLRLRSFVWPFHITRHERLTAALAIAERHPVVVDEAPAGEWLKDRLDSVVDDATTVVWQSFTGQYWPVEETARVRAAVEAAAKRMSVAHVSLEYHGGTDGAELRVSVGAPGAPLASQVLAQVGDHGIPVRLI